jgi:hypothetical protein
MHTSRLRAIAHFLLSTDTKLEITPMLNQLSTSLNNLVSNPTHQPFQADYANTTDRLSKAVSKMNASFEPFQAKAIEELKGQKYFLEDFSTEFKSLLQENPATPTIARDKINQFISVRNQYLDTLRILDAKLEEVGVKTLDFAVDEQAEIGFLIPRQMFSNHLDQLIIELRKINRILRAFSELEIGSPEPIELRSISTSDPLFSFGLNMAVILAVGKTVKWALGVWREVEDIRLVRAQTQKLSSFTSEEVEGIYGTKIKTHVENAIQSKLLELFADKTGSSRKHEQETDLKFALGYILAGIERGLTIEIRHLPPPKSSAAEQETGEKLDTLRTVATLAKELVFPVVDISNPILSLPAEPNGQKSSPPKK